MKKATLLLLVAVMLLSTAVMAAGTVNFAMLEDITTTNIWALLGPSASSWNFYPTLNKYSTLYGQADLTYQVVPGVADGFWTPLQKVTEDGTTYYVSTVHLMKGLKWSDGTPFTADDVVFSYNVPFKTEMPGNWISNIDPAVFAKIEKVNDYTVKFYLHKPSGEFIYGILMSTLVQKKYWEPVYEKALKQADPAKYLMSYGPTLDEPSLGPITISKWQKGAYMEDTAAANYAFKGQQEIEYANGAVRYIIPKLGMDNTYYGTAEGTVTNKFVTGPYVDSIIYRIYQNQAAAVAALLKGEVDYILNPNGMQKGFVEQLKSNPNIKVVENPALGFKYLSFNTRKFPMNIKAFRVAIAYLIDRDLLANKVLQGAAIPLASVVPPANKFWYDPNLKPYGEGMTTIQRYEAAIKTLKDAGFKWLVDPVIKNGQLTQRGMGLIAPNGQMIKQVNMLAPSAGYDPMRSTAALWIEKWANDIGIPIVADLTGFNTILSAVRDLSFDMYILGWGIPIYPSYIKDFFYSKYAGVGGFNDSGYDNPAFDKAANEFVDQTNMDKAREYAFKAEEMINADVPYIVLFTTPIIEAYRTDKVSFAYTDTPDGIQSGYAYYGEIPYVKAVQQ